MIGREEKGPVVSANNAKNIEESQKDEGFIVTPSDKIPKIRASKNKDRVVPRKVGAYNDYTIQVSSSKSKKGAMGLVDKLIGKGYEGYISVIEIPNKGTWYRVRIGHFSTREEAKKFELKMRKKDRIKGIIIPSSR
jgi:cell division septation protein DedD